MKELLQSLQIPKDLPRMETKRHESFHGELAQHAPSRSLPVRNGLISGAVLFAVLLSLRLYWSIPEAVPVQTLTIATLTVPAGSSQALVAGGYVKAARIVYVAPKVSGRIVALKVKEGDEVRAGQVIAEIEAQDLFQEALEIRELAQAATLTKEKLERDLARAVALFKEGILSSQALDQTRMEFQVAAKNLDAAKARMVHADNRLGYTHLFAPIPGRVLRKFRNVGDFVSPDVPFMEGNETVSVGSPVVALTDLGPQQCTADINETDIGRIALNQRVEITPNAFPDQRYTGRVIQISPRADRNKNTLEVKTVVEAGDRVLPYDLSVKISFQAQSRKSEPAREMKIPISALTERDGKRIVYVAIGSHASSRTVEIGDVRDGMVVITRGLSPGDRVIVSNPGALSEGQRLKL